MSKTVIRLDAMGSGRLAAQSVRSPVRTAEGPVLIPPDLHAPANADAEALHCLLASTVRAGDRVLMIGAGLGVASTLVARSACGGQVIVAEPNALLIAQLERVHALNGVENAEVINAMLAVGKRGYVKFNPESDPRSPPQAAGLPPQPAFRVPFMDLNIILAEARINVILCDTPVAPAALLAQTDLGGVERILVQRGSDAAQCWGSDGVCMLLAGHGYEAEPHGAAIRFHKPAPPQRSAGRAGTG